MKIIMMAAFAVVSLCLFGENEWAGSGPDYTFGSESEPLSTCEITVPEDGVSVDSLSLFPALDAVVTLAGGELGFLSDGSVSVSERGAAKFACAVSAAGNLSLSGGMVTLDNLYTEGSAASVLMAGVDAALLEVVSAELVTYGKVKIAHPYHAKTENGEKTLQLQFVDGGWLKCVKVKLVNVDGNAAVKIVYRRYVNSNYNPIGSDFDAIKVGDTSNLANAGSYSSAEGCELKRLTVIRGDGVHGSVFESSLDVAESSALTIAADANVVFDGGGTTNGSDTVSAGVVLDGRLSVANRESTVFAGEISGSGVLALEPWGEAPDGAEIVLGEAKEDAKVLVDQSYSVVLVENASVSSITNVSEVWIKRAPTATAAKARVCLLSNDGVKLKFQAQIYDGGWIKCAVVSVYQSGENIAGTLECTPYYKVASQAEGEAFLGTDIFSVESSWGGNRGNYHLVAMTLHTYDRTERREVVLSAANRQNGGRIEVGAGTRLVLGANECLPSNGVVTVCAGGELEIRGMKTSNVGNEDISSIDVRPGGVLRQKTSDSFAYRGPRISIDGGELALRRGSAGSNPDSGVYLSRVSLSGGARVSGLRARIGSNIASLTSTWYVHKGTSGEPVTINSGFTFVGVALGQSFVVSVDDFADGADLVTCPGAVPLEGDGGFSEFGSNLNYRIPVYKKGAGTWLVRSSSANYHASVIVNEGELALGVDDAFPAAELISLRGGCLSITNASTQTFTELDVTQSSSLVLAEGTSASFAAVASGDWGGRLSVTGDFTGSSPLRIGTSAVLSAQQLGCIRINRHRAVQDEDGYLYPVVPGPVIIVR